MTQTELNKYSKILMKLIPADGTSIGNTRLIRQFVNEGRSEDEYWEVRNALIEAGLIEKGKGKGGSVYKVQEKEPKMRKRKRQKESSLYEPFHKTLTQYWVKNNEIKSYVSEITAQQGKKRTGGKWTRPDITIAAVKKFAFIPGTTLEIVTFEIKPVLDYEVSSVFETAAHSIFAHKSYLAINSADESDVEPDEFERIESLCKRFGIGLITFADAANWETFEEIVEPERKIPDPGAINKFIRTQLSKENQNSLLELLK